MGLQVLSGRDGDGLTKWIVMKGGGAEELILLHQYSGRKDSCNSHYYPLQATENPFLQEM